MKQLIETVEKFLKKKATIGELRRALKQAKEEEQRGAEDHQDDPQDQRRD